MTNLMRYVLWYAKEGIEDGTTFDCFNFLGTQDNKFLDDLSFQSGTGLLNYYFYNYQLKEDMHGDKH